MVSLKHLFLLVNGEAEDEDTNSLFGEASKFHKPGNWLLHNSSSHFPDILCKVLVLFLPGCVVDRDNWMYLGCVHTLPDGFSSADVKSYNPGQKSLGQYCNIHISLSFLGSLFKQCILFEIFLQFSLPLPYTKLKLGKNSGYTRPTLFVGWGEGLDLCEFENAPETQKCPKTFVHDCRSSMVWTPIQYVTLHLRDWRSVGKLHYRNMWSHVRTEALTGMVFVLAQKLCKRYLAQCEQSLNHTLLRWISEYH